MPPRYLRKGPSKLKKCDEFRVDVCDTEKADGCCGVLACNLCLEFEEYGVDIEYGSAAFATNSWSGTVAGLTFVAYWERNYTTDECEFVVVFDDEEVYRESCYSAGVSCRDPGGSVEVSIPYAEGTLTWSVDRKRALPYVIDPDTGCRTWFCGSCECTAECLCVTITEPNTTVTQGEICDASYSDCDPPLWEGTVGGFYLSIELDRDSYGECILTGTVDGEEFEPVYVTGCTDLTATIETYDGTLIEINGKQCSCDTSGCPCCPGWPMTQSGIIAWTSDAAVTDCPTGGEINTTSDIPCSDVQDELGTLIRSSDTELWVRVYCDTDNGTWKVQYRSAASGGGFEPPSSTVWADATDVDFVCPDCDDSYGGIATGTLDFTAIMACETSGGVATYEVTVHGEIEIGCP